MEYFQEEKYPYFNTDESFVLLIYGLVILLFAYFPILDEFIVTNTWEVGNYADLIIMSPTC